MGSYFDRQLRIVSPYLTHTKTLLDFGCGNLALATRIHRAYPDIHVTGVDVVESPMRILDIPFTVYDGTILPFRNQSFDGTISYHVFHHCADPRAAFGEVVRVTRKRILMVEPLYKKPIDLIFMKIADRLGNGWRGVSIPLPFQFQTEATWRRWIREFHWDVSDTKSVGILPTWLPLGESKLFVLTKR